MKLIKDRCILLLLDMNQSVIIENTISQLNSILSSTQEQFTADSDGFFAQNGISSLGKYISIVTNLCYQLNLSSYDELKEYLEKPLFSDLRIRWNNFLFELDNQSVLSSLHPTSLPSDIQLLDVNNNELIDLEKIYTNHDRTLFVFLRHLA
jgi:hypothetical protein